MEVTFCEAVFVRCLYLVLAVHYVTTVLFFAHNAHMYKRLCCDCDQRRVFLQGRDLTLCCVVRAVDCVAIVER